MSCNKCGMFAGDQCFPVCEKVYRDHVRDTERLELMAERGYGIARNTMGSVNDHFFVFNKYGESRVYRNTFREAIDAAEELYK